MVLVHWQYSTIVYFALITVLGMKESLGIASFGIAVTTMEEVFIKVGEGTDEALKSRYNKNGVVLLLLYVSAMFFPIGKSTFWPTHCHAKL